MREHRSVAVAAVMSSAAFLEAAVNELFASAGHDNLEVGGGLGGLTAAERGALVGRAADRISTLDRYELALSQLGRPPLPRGAAPFPDPESTG
jgi:hypothetical protein